MQQDICLTHSGTMSKSKANVFQPLCSPEDIYQGCSNHLRWTKHCNDAVKVVDVKLGLQERGHTPESCSSTGRRDGCHRVGKCSQVLHTPTDVHDITVKLLQSVWANRSESMIRLCAQVSSIVSESFYSMLAVGWPSLGTKLLCHISHA